MKFTVPTTLQQEHEALHDDLRRATQAGGELGEAAKILAGLMHPHFVKEDQIALPPSVPGATTSSSLPSSWCSTRAPRRR